MNQLAKRYYRVLLLTLIAVAILFALNISQKPNRGDRDNGYFNDSLSVAQALSLLDIENLLSGSAPSSDINVAVLDSGIYPHGDLIKTNQNIRKFVDLVNQYELPYDDNGHGTAISGIIANACNNVGLICVKVLDFNGNCSISKLTEGLRWVIDNKDTYGIKIVNVSIGIPIDAFSNYSKLVSAIEEAQDCGLLIVASSGNQTGRGSVKYLPADVCGVLSVGGADTRNDGSLKISKNTATWVNEHGTVIPVVAVPSSNIVSLKSDVYYNPNVRIGEAIHSDYDVFSGTSEAAALITGICAAVLSNASNLTNSDIYEIAASEFGDYLNAN
jgi:serine protease AprX